MVAANIWMVERTRWNPVVKLHSVSARSMRAGWNGYERATFVLKSASFDQPNRDSADFHAPVIRLTHRSAVADSTSAGGGVSKSRRRMISAKSLAVVTVAVRALRTRR